MKVLIAAGASGGHIFPAIALGSSLRRKADNLEILFVCSNRYLDRRIFSREGLNFRCLSSNKLTPRLSFSLLAFPARLALDMAKALFIIAAFRPKVIVGFGGYASFPIVLIGSLAGIPAVIHEQNVAIGKANLFLARFAKKIAVSFKETISRIPDGMKEKVVYTGNPIRTDLLKDDKELALKKFGFDRDKFTLLVIGGSQGAHRLNRIFAESIASLEEARKKDIQIVHIAGEQDKESIEAIYDNFDIPALVFSFLDRIDEAYSAADLVFSRSGSAALSELAYYAKPMVLVPYPYARSHQKENALAFAGKGAAIYKEEGELTPREFRSMVLELMDNREKLAILSKMSRSLSMPDASDRLADVVMVYNTFIHNKL